MAARSRTPNLRFSAELAGRIVEHARSGLFRYLAAEIEGIGVSTIESWVARGRDNLAQIQREIEEGGPRGPSSAKVDHYGRFVSALEAAEGEAEARWLGVVNKIALDPKAPPADRIRAATWLLKAKNNARYGGGGKQVEVPDDGLSDLQEVTETVLAKLSQVERRITPSDGSPTTH